MRTLRGLARALVDTAKLASGGATYSLTGKTPAGAYQAMIRLFCSSGGASNDYIDWFLRSFGRMRQLPEPNGFLGVRNHDDAERIANNIRVDGFHVFERRLPSELCDRLLRFALETPARIRPLTGGAGEAARRAVYDRKHPLAVRYDLEPNDVLNCPDVQGLMAEPSILSVAQAYLRTTPVADVMSMWWHTAFSERPDEEAGQFFHFDMDRVKWLKFFIYITDVGVQDGPHCFVRGSHRTGGIPAPLLQKGYARISDDEVLRHYPTERIIQFVAPKGTVIAEDTRGLHKGKEVQGGDRLMLQIQFSSSLFGGTYPRSRFGRITNAALARRISEHRPVYANYLEGGSVI